MKKKSTIFAALCFVAMYAAAQLPVEYGLPVTFGVSSKGLHRLDGRFIDARIYARTLSDSEAAAYCSGKDGAKCISRDRLVWEGVPKPGDECEAVKQADYSAGFTFACRVILNKAGGRLVDNTIGGRDGWLIDTWPDRPRFYCHGTRVGDHVRKFAIGREQSLVATFNDGKTSMWLDGERCDYTFDSAAIFANEWRNLVEKKAKPLEWIFPTGDETPQEGMRFADGVTGVLAWGGGDTLKLTVGRADLWDHRGGSTWTCAQSYTNITDAILKKDKARLYGLFEKRTPPGEPREPFMLPLGRVEVKIPGAALLDGALDVKTGVGTIDFLLGGRTNRAELAMSKASRAFALKLPEGTVYTAKSVNCMEQPAVRTELSKLGYKPAKYEKDDGNGGGFTWDIPADPPVTLLYARRGGELTIRTWRGEVEGGPGMAAARFDGVRSESAAHWAKFWAEGANVKVPDPVVQGLFDYGMYCFGCMTDPDGVPCGLQGAWIEDNYIPQWSGDYHFNINVQECYSPAYRGGHFANMMPLFRMVLGWKPRLRDNARKFADVEGYVLPHAVDDRGVTIGGMWTGTIDHGSTAWVADMMFRYVKYSRDVDFLRRDAYDFMQGAMRVYRAMMTEDGKGGLAFPTGPSPEWGGASFETAVGRNPSFQLAAAHRLARNLIAAAAMLGESPDPMWLDVEKRLPLAAIDDGQGGILLFEGRPFSASHRHHSHLAGLFPFDIFDLRDPATAATVRKSYETWDARGTTAWTGWCVPWAAVLNVHAGRAERAVKMLHDYDEYFTNPGHAPRNYAWKPGYSTIRIGRARIGADGRYVGHETLDMDGLISACAAVMEMMAHDVNGRTEFFRGCPDEWKDVSFENITLSDGRRVSGRRVDGKVEIEEGRCRGSGEVRESLAPYVERGEIAGVVSVLSDADYNESWDCIGWADAENKVPMRPDTVFAVFSMTKTFTGCAVMIAVDRGILRMDDRVEKYLPEFRRLENKVTIRECMCHTTGITGGDVEIIHTGMPLREQARKWALEGRCSHKPGEAFIYGNNSIAAAAACIEVASGIPYERFLKDNVLDPLGMKDTTFTPDEDQQRRMVKAYTTDGGPFRPAADRWNQQLKFPAGHRIYPMPSAGLYSTPADMIRFSQMLAHHGEWKGRRIVTRRTFDEIWAVKQTPPHILQPYTAGAWLYGDWFGHEGAMRTDQRANLKTGHSRVFFLQTENKAGSAFFDAKRAWHRACDRFQGMDVPFSENLVKTHENDRRQ